MHLSFPGHLPGSLDDCAEKQSFPADCKVNFMTIISSSLFSIQQFFLVIGLDGSSGVVNRVHVAENKSAWLPAFGILVSYWQQL